MILVSWILELVRLMAKEEIFGGFVGVVVNVLDVKSLVEHDGES